MYCILLICSKNSFRFFSPNFLTKFCRNETKHGLGKTKCRQIFAKFRFVTKQRVHFGETIVRTLRCVCRSGGVSASMSISIFILEHVHKGDDTLTGNTSSTVYYLTFFPSWIFTGHKSDLCLPKSNTTEVGVSENSDLDCSSILRPLVSESVLLTTQCKKNWRKIRANIRISNLNKYLLTKVTKRAREVNRSVTTERLPTVLLIYSFLPSVHFCSFLAGHVFLFCVH